MSGKIFKSAFFTSMIVLIISFLLIFSVLFDYFESRVFAELKSETNYIAYSIKYDAEDFLKSFDEENKRITLIAPNGDVIADTEADATTLENHADRKEVRDAIESGTGRNERYSGTFTEKTLYYAIKLDDGNVLRLSTTQSSVLAILLGLMQPTILIIVAALAVSLFLSYRVSNAIIRPINELDLDNPETAEAYEELTPLLKKLTAQKQTISRQIKEVEKSREEFRLICENMQEGFLVLDKEARVLSYNSAVLRLLEIDSINNDSVLTLNRSKNFREVTENALNGRRGENTIKIEGNTYNLIANSVCRSGEVIGAVIVIIDITESARREQLRREFTSNVSHELKTPLTSISGFAEMMKSGDMPEETVKDFSKSIYDEAQRMISLVADIMEISELDEGAVMCDMEKVDLYDLSQDIADRLTAVAKSRGVDVNVIGDTAYVTGARKILDEMVYNLCDNAIKYNKPNGIVDIIISTTVDRVKLTVRDTGIGIANSEQPRVFERFYRVDKSRSKSAGGTGLGLAIVKHGAMYHNANVTLESAEGKGTTVTLDFVNADTGASEQA